MDTKTFPLVLFKGHTLLKADALINGQWIAGTRRFDILDPATDHKLADVANLGPAWSRLVSQAESWHQPSSAMAEI